MQEERLRELQDIARGDGSITFGNLVVGDVVEITTLNSLYEARITGKNFTGNQVKITLQKKESLNGNSCFMDKMGAVAVSVLDTVKMRVDHSFPFGFPNGGMLYISMIRVVKVKGHQILPIEN